MLNFSIRLHTLLPLLLILLCACVPAEQSDKGMNSHSPDASSLSATGIDKDTEVPPLPDLTTAAALTDTIPEELTPPEPEKTVAQEVQELNKLGKWEEGSPEPITKKAKVEYDFPITMNRQVEFYLDFFQNKQRKTFARWLARSGRYLPMIHEHLKEAGLPLDLAYLPMIESGYSLTAYSKAKAVGPWQFMRSTGLHYGLTVNSYVDERRDPVKSTKAAITFLSELYKKFGSWHLAVAGYNAGGGTIKSAIRRSKTKNFWKIAQTRYLHSETKRYVPKLIAAIIIAKNPEKYGFTDIEYQAPLSFETVEVPRWTSLRAVASAGNLSLEELRNLNRDLRQGITPPEKPYTIKIPVGKKTIVAQNLSRVHAVVSTKYETHIVRKGETLQKICKKYKLSATTMLKANNLRKSKLTPGQRLRIPTRKTTYRLLAKNENPDRRNISDNQQRLVLHTILPGETVSIIARKYDISSHMLCTWNTITDINRITAGDQLAIYLEEETKTIAMNQPAEQSISSKILVATTQKIKYSPSKQPKTITTLAPTRFPFKKLTYYEVKGGDSLWTIARRFNLSTEKIKRWNNIKGNIIQPGRRLLLKVESDADV